jgi:hypothetical protein
LNDTGAATLGEFFQAGGTLAPDAPSYVERAADRELFEKVSAGELCYVLTPRQMGKSSLMARTAERLKRADVRSAVIDLSAIGGQKDEMSAEQWYYAIANRLLKDLELTFDLAGWWETHRLLPAVNRMMQLFAEAVLARIDGRAVVFVDEIDTTIALPFSDDFFAAIRAFYNTRATAPDYRRLSFVLLGCREPDGSHQGRRAHALQRRPAHRAGRFRLRGGEDVRDRPASGRRPRRGSAPARFALDGRASLPDAEALRGTRRLRDRNSRRGERSGPCDRHQGVPGPRQDP